MRVKLSQKLPCFVEIPTFLPLIVAAISDQHFFEGDGLTRGIRAVVGFDPCGEIVVAWGSEKGEEMEWLLEDRNTFVLRRIQPKKSVVKGKMPLT